MSSDEPGDPPEPPDRPDDLDAPRASDAADGSGGADTPPTGLSRRARLLIVVAALGGLMLVGVLVGQRRRNDYDGTMRRVEAAAQVAGGSIDVGDFQAAWADQQVATAAGDPAMPAGALVPAIPGADVASYTFVPDPVQVVIDYQVDEGGQQGCVRLVRAPDGTTVRRDDNVCARAFRDAP